MPKLKYVAFHEAILAPSAGSINAQKTLGADRTGHPDLEMWYPDKEWPGCIVLKSNHEIVPIPLANVKSMIGEKVL